MKRNFIGVATDKRTGLKRDLKISTGSKLNAYNVLRANYNKKWEFTVDDLEEVNIDWSRVEETEKEVADEVVDKEAKKW